MRPEAEWPKGARHRSKEQIVEAMRAELERRPGVQYNFSQPIKDRVEESISGIRGQIVVKIYGEDLNLMHEKLEEIRRILASTRGSRDVGDLPRRHRAAHRRRHRSEPPSPATGCRCGTSRTWSRAAMAARSPPSMWEGERKVGVRVMLPEVGGGGRRDGRPSGYPRRRRRQGPSARVPLGIARQRARRRRADPDQPRAGRAVPGHQVQHRGARHGLASWTRRRRACSARSSCPPGTT